MSSPIKPWLTSSQIVDAINRKISVPVSQNTLSEDDILRFVNEEMMIAQVPSVLSFNEEFFVDRVTIPLVDNQKRYTIPERAIGMKLRDLFYQDSGGSLHEMTRVSPDDQDYFSAGVSGSSSNPARMKYFLENNDVIMISDVVSPTGSLVMTYFLRPNQLVRETRAAIISSFLKKITVENAFANNGEKVTVNGVEFKFSSSTGGSITAVTPGTTTSVLTCVAHGLETGYTINLTLTGTVPTITSQSFVVEVIDANTFSIRKAIASAPGPIVGTFTCFNQILIGVDSAATASNLKDSLLNSGVCVPTVSSSVITLSFTSPIITISVSDVNAVIVEATQGVRFESVPQTDLDADGVSTTVFAEGSLIDFLQTKPGHKIRDYDLIIPIGGFVSATDIFFDQIPQDLVVGDYMCLANECIIPQLPPDLHNGLAERACVRILASSGDMEGMQSSQIKIAEIQKAEGQLLDNRVDGSQLKVNVRHSMLGFQKGSNRRRF